VVISSLRVDQQMLTCSSSLAVAVAAVDTPHSQSTVVVQAVALVA
jgi:hypothetical protein